MAKNQPKPEETAPEAPALPTMLCKFQCTSAVDVGGTDFAQRIHMYPVSGDYPDGKENENKSFSKFTPSGVFELLVTNENAEGFYESGAAYLIQITKLPAPTIPPLNS